jgi:hypothetical protein
MQCDRLITVFVGVSAGNHLIAVFCVCLLCDQMIELFFYAASAPVRSNHINQKCKQQDY